MSFKTDTVACMQAEPRVIAHRTCPRHAAENSVAGIRMAHALGADGVEIDVQRSLDGVLLLHHDHTLWRKARLPVPLWMVPSWLVRRRLGAERLVTLEAALDATAPGLLIAIDIKHPRAARAVAAAVRGRRMEQQALLWSKSIRACALLAKIAPGFEVAFLCDAKRSRSVRTMLRNATGAAASAISVHWDIVTPAFVAEAHSRGLLVYAMARDSESQAAKLDCGIDGVVTDWPEDAISLAHKRTPSIQ